MFTISKVTENRLRRVAQRQGYELHKSRARDTRHQLYGKYRLVADVFTMSRTGYDSQKWMTADQISEFLGEPI